MGKEKINILICEDDELNMGLNQKFVEIISKRENREVVIHSFSGITKHMLTLMESSRIDLAILDIELGNGSGMDIAKKLVKKNPRLPIIFVTGYQEYKAFASDILAVGFVEKPVKLEKFDILLTRALILACSELDKRKCELFDIVVNKKHIQLRLASIISVEKVLRKVEFHTSKGVYAVNGTLNELLEGLGSGFIKISQSVAVNQDRILSIDRSSIYLTNGEQYTIGRTYIKSVRDMCEKHAAGSRGVSKMQMKRGEYNGGKQN